MFYLTNKQLLKRKADHVEFTMYKICNCSRNDYIVIRYTDVKTTECEMTWHDRGHDIQNITYNVGCFTTSRTKIGPRTKFGSLRLHYTFGRTGPVSSIKRPFTQRKNRERTRQE